MNEDSSATLPSSLAGARAGFGSVKDVAPGRSLVDELIADRRIEAARELGLTPPPATYRQ